MDLMTGRIAVTPPSRYGDAWRARIGHSVAQAPHEALGLAAGDSVVVVGAHPDDETLGLGAALADLADHGVAVHALCLTAGEAALDHVGVAVPGLASRRRAELAAAAAALGLASARVAAFPDGRLEEQETDLAAHVAEVIVRHGAGQVLTVWWDDPHPDHAAAGRAAARAADSTGARVSGFPVWAPHWCDPTRCLTGNDRLISLTTTDTARARKAEALGAYRSQTHPIDDRVEAVLPAEVCAWPHELLVPR